MATVAIIGTCDTKLQELLFLKDRIEENPSVSAILLDVGWKATEHEAITVPQVRLISQHGSGQNIADLSRGQFIEFISQCVAKEVRRLYESGSIDAIVSAGGSGGTSLVSAVMRQVLPIGFPKLIVSTVASGDTGPVIGETDITLMYSVVDVAGLNHVLRNILSNAGASIAAAALSYADRKKSATAEPKSSQKKRVGITMFGVTTPGADAIRSHLEANYPVETYVFHATGRGGKAMERLIREGTLDGVIDLTTTEIADLVVGGVFPAEQDRLDAAIEAGIPNILSLGATDVVNFGARGTLPDEFKHRNIVKHNPIVTLVRTLPDDCRQIGEFIARKIRNAKNPGVTQLWIPKGGVSMLATPGQPFADAEADDALFGVIRKGIEGSGVEIVEDERDVNDKGFARDIADVLAAKMGLAKGKIASMA
ncbi:hypothetical protein EYZ11_012123 [Aspergillus tanneri]|uniref:Uncharacterized protein n=1 Tax=Aspergillus tanneri TaxID=1220188 RepID=A0A4S3J122_9EURO|nr:uncharacterized protein ATNIH1004_005351 [Aspergillus tanneri]KAA8646676.1 hypothetical protein ATNIH1004_005351 [Aspergillus tanneri]THC88430.1 hypothetical protein EYZ11_012123 [Aspergillus tanneri]